MLISIFLQAFVTTFAMLCVVGPICMTVINTTIIHGFRVGYMAGLGVSVADTIYIIGASLAISALENILQSKVVVIIGLCGGLFLYYLSYKFWNTKPNTDSQTINGCGLKSFVALFCLTLTGPTTMITYSIVFGSFLSNGSFDALSAILGACFGTYLFYFLLTYILSVVRRKISNEAVFKLNKLATLVIFTLATKLIYDGIKTLIY